MKTKSKSRAVAENLRKKALRLRSDKELIARGIFGKVCEGIDHAGTYGEALQASGRAVTSAAEALTVAATQPALKKMGLAIVENTVSNISDRVQELATLIEAAGKDPKINEAFNNFQEAIKAAEKVHSKFKKATSLRMS